MTLKQAWPVICLVSEWRRCIQSIHCRMTWLSAVCACAEEDAAELDRLRRLLCIPREEVDKVNKEICGRIYQDVSHPAPVLASIMRPQ